MARATLTPFIEKVLGEWFDRTRPDASDDTTRRMMLTVKQAAMVTRWTSETDAIAGGHEYTWRSTCPVVSRGETERWYFSMHRFPNKAAVAMFVDYGTRAARRAAEEAAAEARYNEAMAELARLKAEQGVK